MSNSLRVKIKNLRYKGVITDKDCDRLIMALDNMDALDKIRAEIEEQVLESLSDGGDDWFTAEKVNKCLEIIDKYKVDKEVSDEKSNNFLH